MSRAAETAVELRRIAAQVRKHADRMDRMADNLDAGRPLADGIGRVVFEHGAELTHVRATDDTLATADFVEVRDA